MKHSKLASSPIVTPYKRSLFVIVILGVMTVFYLTNAGSADGSGTGPTGGTHSVFDHKEGQEAEISQQPPINRPETVEAGTVLFRSDDHNAELPLVAIAANYAIDGPDPYPVAPTKAFSEIRFPVPPEQASMLAAYWVTTIINGDDGILLLGPRGWKAESSIGANGSIGITLTNPDDELERVQYSDTAGGCQGCAISSIATYFPELREWAESMDFFGTDMKFTRQTLLSPHLMAYEKAGEHAEYETNGIAYQEHENGAWFRMIEMQHTDNHRGLVKTIIDFFTDLENRKLD